jgi:hypothetical protein
MMAITTKTQLKTACLLYIKNDTITEPSLDQYIDIATARIGEVIKTSANQFTLNLTTSAEVNSLVSQRPSQIAAVSMQSGSAWKSLEGMVQNQIGMIEASGKPLAFNLTGEDLRIRPIPSANVFEIVYFKRPIWVGEALDPSGVLERFSDVYLYATVAEVFLSLQDTEQHALYSQQFQNALATANATADVYLSGSRPRMIKGV